MPDDMPQPVAHLSGPVVVGTPTPPVDPRPVDLDAQAYVEEEWFASGTAEAYEAVGSFGADGRWDVRAVDTAPYTTRLVVRRPRDRDRSSGTVFVEWLNVSTLEAAPEWAYVGPTLVDEGATWVGVSVQALGVVGGAPLVSAGGVEDGGGIRASNPERYGDLAHPGDAFAFAIWAQVAAALRQAEALTGGPVRALVAGGQSQSAGFLTTFVNAFQPRTGAYDGYFVHSRGSGAARLDGSPALRADGAGYRIRDDSDVPVLILETETDVGPVLGYALARQPGGRHVRTWEVAGTAHADAHIIGRDTSFCPQLVNDGPHHIVAKAGLAALLRWVGGGEAPLQPPPIATGGDPGTEVKRDDDGIARGGVRTPSVDVPSSVLSGDPPPGSDRMCSLFGSREPFDPSALTARYGTQEAYLARFDASLDEAVGAGFVRPVDRDAYAAEARQVSFDG